MCGAPAAPREAGAGQEPEQAWAWWVRAQCAFHAGDLASVRAP